MKKTKLLTSLSALMLILSLGACDEIIEEQTSESTVPSESEPDTGETTDSTETGESEPGGGETGDTSDSTGSGETEGIVFGFMLDDELNAIDGKTQTEGTYRGSYTSNLNDAVRVSYENGSETGEYYLSFELDSTTYWITITEGEHTNLSYATEKAPLYWNPTYDCWGNQTQTYFLCQNATYQCLYASAISQYIESSPIAGLYNVDGTKVEGFTGEVYVEPITDIPYFEVEEPEDGKEYYLGFPYASSGSTDWYMFNGTTDSYGDYLQCSVLGSNEPTSAVLIKTTANGDNWGLTFTLNGKDYTIYAWPSTSGSNNYGEITFIETTSLGSAKSGAVTTFGWDNDNACFTVSLSNGDWYFETYQGKSSVSLALASTNYTRAHLYTANPEYVIPNPTSITVTGSNSLYVGNTTQLSVTVEPSNAHPEVTWSTSSAAIATVSDTGLVTGTGEGEVRITATSTKDTSVYGSIDITVTTYNVPDGLVGTITFNSSDTKASTNPFTTSTLQTCLTAAYSGTGTITAGETQKTYPGSNGSGTGLKGSADCVQLGAGSGTGNNGAFAFSLSDTDDIVKVVVKVVYYDSVKNMTINDNAISIGYNCTGYSSWDDVPETVYELTATKSFKISNNAGERMLIHSIELYSA